MKNKPKWFIDSKGAADVIEGKEILRISVGGSEETGYYIVYRGKAKPVGELLRRASDDFDEMLKTLGVFDGEN